MRGGTRMKMDADNCVSRIYGRYGDESRVQSSFWLRKTRTPERQHHNVTLVGGRADTNHFLRFPLGFFFTVSAAGTVCSGSENSLTRASSSWILCIVCETLAMMRDF